MRSLFILILVAIFLVGAAKNRYYGALLYWWFAIFRPQDWIWWDVSALRLPLIVAAIFVIPCFLQGIRPKLNHPIFVFMVAVLGFELIGYILAGCGLTGDIQMEHLLKLVLVVMLTERVLQTKKELFGLVFLAGFSLCFHSADMGLYSLKQGGTSFYGTNAMTGSFSGSNAFALGTAVLLFFMIIVLQSAWRKEKNLLPKFMDTDSRRAACIFAVSILLVGSIYLVISIFSRGSALAMGASLLLWCALQPNRLKIFTALTPIALIAVLLVPLPEGYEERIQSVFAEGDERDKSAESRPYFWGIAKEMSDVYTFGVGPGCYKKYYDQFDTTNGYYGKGRSVHSSHFQILAEAGKPGFIAWILLIASIFSFLLKIRARGIKEANSTDSRFFIFFANGMICALVTFVLGGAFYELAHTEMIWLIGLLTVAANKIQKRAEKQTEANEIAQEKRTIN